MSLKNNRNKQILILSIILITFTLNLFVSNLISNEYLNDIHQDKNSNEDGKEILKNQDLSPDNADFQDTLGEILFKLEKFSEALNIMQKAADLDSKYKEKLEQFRKAAQ